MGYAFILAFKNSTFCPHSMFVCFVCTSEQAEILSVHNINELVFMTERVVYRAVIIGPLNIKLTKLGIKRVQ